MVRNRAGTMRIYAHVAHTVARATYLERKPMAGPPQVRAVVRA